MPTPFLGEIKLFSYGWAPRGWALCDGALLTISEYSQLFSLLGITYGGDGRSTFALPDLRGRVPVHTDYTALYPPGYAGGQENVTLSLEQLARHNHTFQVSSKTADTFVNLGDYSLGVTTGAVSAGLPAYGLDYADTTMSSYTCSFAGGGKAHYNVQPTGVASFCIATTGIYPLRQ